METIKPPINLVGYARISTEEQRLDLQTDALESEGCIKIFHDVASGASQKRDGLTSALEYLHPGDTLVVWKLDRLGRTVKGLITLVETLRGRGVHLKSLTDGIDTGTPAGLFFFHVMAALSQMERDLLRERTQAGLAAARARGRLGGRRPLLSKDQVRHAWVLTNWGHTVTEVAESLGASRSTLYRALKQYNSPV